MTATATAAAVPAAPYELTYPTQLRQGQAYQVTWSVAAAEGNTPLGVILERSVDGTEWVEVYRGVLLTFRDRAGGWESVAYRAKSFDTAGAESPYLTGETRTVESSAGPVISGADEDLGTLADGLPTKTYTISGGAAGSITVVETVDGEDLSQTTTTAGDTAHSVSLGPETWQKLLNGRHELVITATDSAGNSGRRTFQFTKANNALVLVTNQLPADERPALIGVRTAGVFCPGSSMKVEACNNAYDTAPTWEDMTAEVEADRPHTFTNANKTGAAWGVAIRVSLSRGSAGGEIHLDHITINYR